jgi:predicted PurR-regulated permease PerM
VTEPSGAADDAGPQVAEWSHATRRLVGVLLIGLVLLIVYVSRSIISTLVVAGILAFVVRPVVGRLEQRGLRRGVAVGVVYLGVILAGILVLLLVIPRVLHELQGMVGTLAGFIAGGPTRAQALLEPMRVVRLGTLRLDFSPLVDQALRAVRSAESPADLVPLERLVGPVQQLLGAASNLFLSAVGLFISAVLALALSLYMSLEAPLIQAGLEAYVGKAHTAEGRALMARIMAAWSDFLRGQLVLMLIIGVVVGIGDWLLGVPGALVLGIIAGLLEVLPNIGPVLATVPAIIIALVSGSEHLGVSNTVFALIVVAFYILVQQIENNLVVPRVIGRAVALPSVVVMAAVLVGAKAGGVLGALIAAPTAATLREIMAYALDKVRGIDPYPEIRHGAAAHTQPTAATLDPRPPASPAPD